MSKPPKVSVIMSVLNGARFLREAVDSIMAQTFRDFEFIIVDDGSTDSTREIILSYSDPRIRPLENAVNRGLPVSLNRCLRLARGEYVARQDADDMSLPRRLELQVAELDGKGSIGVVGGWWHKIDQEGRVFAQSRAPTEGNVLLQQLVNDGINPAPHGSMMMRKELLDAVGGYDERFWFTQDFDLWLRLSSHGEFAVVPSFLYQSRKLPTIDGFKEACQRAYYHRAVEQYKAGRRHEFEDVREYVRRTFPDSLVSHERQMESYWGELGSIAARGGSCRLPLLYRFKALRASRPLAALGATLRLLAAIVQCLAAVTLLERVKGEPR